MSRTAANTATRVQAQAGLERARVGVEPKRLVIRDERGAMSYDETLAERVRLALLGHTGVSEKKMFGGICFLLGGRMICGVAGDELMVRVGSERDDEALAKPRVRLMDFTGRPMKGYVFVAPPRRAAQAEVAAWVEWAVDFASTLPPAKTRGARSRRRVMARSSSVPVRP